MKNRTAAGSSGAVSEIVQAAREAAVDMITEWVNQIVVKGVIIEECEPNIIVNFKGEKRFFRKSILQGLKFNRSNSEDIWENCREVDKIKVDID